MAILRLVVHHIESEIGPLGNPQRESGIPLGEYKMLFDLKPASS